MISERGFSNNRAWQNVDTQIQINTEKHADPPHSRSSHRSLLFWIVFVLLPRSLQSTWGGSAEGTCSADLFLEKTGMIQLHIYSRVQAWTCRALCPEEEEEEEDAYQKIIRYSNVFLGNEVSVQVTAGKQTKVPCLTWGDKEMTWSGEVDQGGCVWIMTPTPRTHTSSTCWQMFAVVECNESVWACVTSMSMEIMNKSCYMTTLISVAVTIFSFPQNVLFNSEQL